jgi:hypothetical protein
MAGQKNCVPAARPGAGWIDLSCRWEKLAELRSAG